MKKTREERRAEQPRALPPNKRRDYRGNLLLNDQEEAIWKELLADLTARSHRPVSGSELLRLLVLPTIKKAAKKFDLPLDEEEITLRL